MRNLRSRFSIMARIEKKLEQIRLQHQITEILWKDNGVTSHFDYHVNPVSDEHTIKLNVLTYNPRHDEYMLLHSTTGSSSVVCLKKMLDYLKAKHTTKTKYSFTIVWRKKNETEDHKSYFVATSEEEARLKFLHEKDVNDYEFSLEMNPLT